MIHNPILIIVAGLTCGSVPGITPRKASHMRQYKPDLRRIARTTPEDGRLISAAGQVVEHLTGRLGVPSRSLTSTATTGRTPAPMLPWAGSAYAPIPLPPRAIPTPSGDPFFRTRSREHIANVREQFAVRALLVCSGGAR